MKVLMKRFEKLALDFAKTYKAWELQCVSKDSYMAGYRQALQDAEKIYKENINGSDPCSGDDIVSSWCNLQRSGQNLVEVEFNNGAHQLIDDISRKPHPTTTVDQKVLPDNFLKEI